MTVFWAGLAVLVLAALAAGWRTLRQVRRHPCRHPGDGVPDVPQDAAIRQQRG